MHDEEINRHAHRLSRRQLLGRTSWGRGAGALTSRPTPSWCAAEAKPFGAPFKVPHFAPKAKRVIYLFQSGGPSHLELFDHKPKLVDLFGQDLPPSVRMGQRLTGMTSGQSKFPMIPSKFAFKRHGQSGMWVSEL